jgi:hypothetical protein
VAVNDKPFNPMPGLRKLETAMIVLQFFVELTSQVAFVHAAYTIDERSAPTERAAGPVAGRQTDVSDPTLKAANEKAASEAAIQKSAEFVHLVEDMVEDASLGAAADALAERQPTPEQAMLLESLEKEYNAKVAHAEAHAQKLFDHHVAEHAKKLLDNHVAETPAETAAFVSGAKKHYQDGLEDRVKDLTTVYEANREMIMKVDLVIEDRDPRSKEH